MAKRVTKPIKYTDEFVLKELQAMLNEIKADPELIYIGQLFEYRDYSQQRFSEWPERFKNNTQILETIKRIESIFESRAAVGGITGKLNPTMTIFHLKNNYNWKDRSEVETLNIGVTLSGQQAEQLIRARANRSDIQRISD